MQTMIARNSQPRQAEAKYAKELMTKPLSLLSSIYQFLTLNTTNDDVTSTMTASKNLQQTDSS